MRQLLLAAALLLGLTQASFAGSFTPFTPAALQAAQDSGRPIIVEVYAPWCPICARQQPILEKLEASGDYKGLTVLRVDFDSQKTELRQLHVAMQSTLIAYHGKTETGRLVGVVNKADIDALFASTLKG